MGIFRFVLWALFVAQDLPSLRTLWCAGALDVDVVAAVADVLHLAEGFSEQVRFQWVVLAKREYQLGGEQIAQGHFSFFHFLLLHELDNLAPLERCAGAQLVGPGIEKLFPFSAVVGSTIHLILVVGEEPLNAGRLQDATDGFAPRLKGTQWVTGPVGSSFYEPVPGKREDRAHDLAALLQNPLQEVWVGELRVITLPRSGNLGVHPNPLTPTTELGVHADVIPRCDPYRAVGKVDDLGVSKNSVAPVCRGK